MTVAEEAGRVTEDFGLLGPRRSAGRIGSTYGPRDRPAERSRLWHFSIFNVVGGMGIVVQLAALWGLVHFAGLHYLLATGLATETAILHNFAWHRRWTWRDRAAPATEWRRRLVRFHLTNGLVSVLGNLALMAAFTGWMDVPYLPANLAAIAICSIANFVASDDYVFRSAPSVPDQGQM
jgi:putative flippase GtrA